MYPNPMDIPNGSQFIQLSIAGPKSTMKQTSHRTQARSRGFRASEINHAKTKAEFLPIDGSKMVYRLRSRLRPRLESHGETQRRRGHVRWIKDKASSRKSYMDPIVMSGVVDGNGVWDPSYTLVDRDWGVPKQVILCRIFLFRRRNLSSGW
jgi:hypothetical protein